MSNDREQGRSAEAGFEHEKLRTKLIMDKKNPGEPLFPAMLT